MMPKKAHLEKHASMGAECQLSDKDSQLLCGQIATRWIGKQDSTSCNSRIELQKNTKAQNIYNTLTTGQCIHNTQVGLVSCHTIWHSKYSTEFPLTVHATKNTTCKALQV